LLRGKNSNRGTQYKLQTHQPPNQPVNQQLNYKHTNHPINQSTSNQQLKIAIL